MAVGRSGYGRRRFVQLMGWAGVVAMARGGPALAAAAAKSRAKSVPPAAKSHEVVPPAATPPPATGSAATPEISDEARALAEVVRRRYKDHVSEEDLAVITRDLDGDLRGVKRLREVKLVNADEPDTTFHA